MSQKTPLNNWRYPLDKNGRCWVVITKRWIACSRVHNLQAASWKWIWTMEIMEGRELLWHWAACGWWWFLQLLFVQMHSLHVNGRPEREKIWRTSNILSLVNFRLMLTDYVLKFKGCYREAWWDDTRGSGLKVLGFLSWAGDVGLRFDERIYASFVCIMFPPTE